MYRILKVVFDESTIRSLISLGRFLFWKLSLISTQLTILFLNAVGVALMIKSIYLGWGEGGGIGKFIRSPSRETRTVFCAMI